MVLHFLSSESSNGPARMGSFSRLQGRSYFFAFSSFQKLLTLLTHDSTSLCLLLSSPPILPPTATPVKKSLTPARLSPFCKDSCDYLGPIQIISHLKFLNVITSAHSLCHLKWHIHRVLEIRILTSQEGHYLTYHTLQLVFFLFFLFRILHFTAKNKHKNHP